MKQKNSYESGYTACVMFFRRRTNSSEHVGGSKTFVRIAAMDNGEISKFSVQESMSVGHERKNLPRERHISVEIWKD